MISVIYTEISIKLLYQYEVITLKSVRFQLFLSKGAQTYWPLVS